MTFLIRPLIVIGSYIISLFLAAPFGFFYDLFPSTTLGGGFIGSPGAVASIVGYPLVVIFTLTFLMHALGGKYKWHWNVLALAPAIIPLGFDLPHIYIPLLLAVAGWGLGVLMNKLLTKLAPSFMARIRG